MSQEFTFAAAHWFVTTHVLKDGHAHQGLFFIQYIQKPPKRWVIWKKMSLKTKIPSFLTVISSWKLAVGSVVHITQVDGKKRCQTWRISLALSDACIFKVFQQIIYLIIVEILYKICKCIKFKILRWYTG